jgi:rhamnulokinase
VKGKALVAVDLGGESCRVSLLRWNSGRPKLQLIHRFSNGPVVENEHLRWDINSIYEGIETGLRLCAEIAEEGIAAIGVDGWGVDYVRMKPGGDAQYNPFCYRDERTIEAEKEVHRIISRERLYGLTGIQLLRFNTLYQLYADRADTAAQHLRWIQIPEFIMHRLGGEAVSEYTNATHSALVDLNTRDWCPRIFEEIALDVNAPHRIVPTGAIIGKMKPRLAELSALKKTELIVPACHDTASAVAGIPAEGDDWAFISSGTWSLVGTLLDSPCNTAEALDRNFSNLGGAGGKICFLKNVNGMWLLGQCLAQWKLRGYEFSLVKLLEACSELSAPKHLLNVDDPEFLLPGDIPAVINAHLVRAGEIALSYDREGIARMANLIMHSLAARYAQVLLELEDITKKKIRGLYIVGGGSRNEFLNRLTAERTGLKVVIGAAESSTLGNLAVQLAALDGDYSSTTGVSYAAVTKWASNLAVLSG